MHYRVRRGDNRPYERRVYPTKVEQALISRPVTPGHCASLSHPVPCEEQSLTHSRRVLGDAAHFISTRRGYSHGMNAQTKITEALPLTDFDNACARLNQWRGQMIENFARCEQAVTETLALLNAASIAVKGVKFPHLVGQRYDRLEGLLTVAEPQTGHIKGARASITQFRIHDGLRAMLCHGVTKIAIDRAGEWVALLTLMKFQAGTTSITRLTLLECEGTLQLGRIIDDRRRVTSALGQVRREFTLAC
jgi:hypothetical protein